MYSLLELVERVAKTIDERRKGALACVSVRPKHVFDSGSGIYKAAAAYILDIVAGAGLAMRQEARGGVRYMICKDSELYRMPKEEMVRRFMEEIKKAEEKAEIRSEITGHETHIYSELYATAKGVDKKGRFD